MANPVHISLWYLRASEVDGGGLRRLISQTFPAIPTKPAIRRAVGALAEAARAAPDYRADSIQPDLGEAIDAPWLWDAARRGTRASVESPRGWILSIVADGGDAQ